MLDNEDYRFLGKVLLMACGIMGVILIAVSAVFL